MPTKQTVLRNITIGEKKLKGEVVLHRHELDGSQTILIRTQPRKSVQKFLYEEPLAKK
jgi:hypothetical protein